MSKFLMYQAGIPANPLLSVPAERILARQIMILLTCLEAVVGGVFRSR
jgi:hypothetical protein